MDEPVRWVTKAEAARELEISLSTLDRKIRKGEVEAVREGRRVYVRMRGPEYLSDDELLRHAIIRLDESEQPVANFFGFTDSQNAIRNALLKQVSARGARAVG